MQLIKDTIWFLRHGIPRSLELWWRCGLDLWAALLIEWNVARWDFDKWWDETERTSE